MNVLIAMLLSVCFLGDQEYTSNATGLDKRNLDETCKPCDDFYQYANGGWMAKNPIPEAYSQWNSIYEMRDRNATLLKEILEGSAAEKNAPQGSPKRLIGDFFAAGMDLDRINNLGIKPIEADLKKIEGLNSPEALQAFLAESHRNGFSYLFGFYVSQDLKQSDRNILYLTQGGLGLPDRDYYFREDEKSKDIRKKYEAHVAKMLQFLGESEEQASENAKKVMNFEKRLAKASMDRVTLRDPNKRYNLLKIAEIQAIVPNFNMKSYLKTLGVSIDECSFAYQDFFKEMNLMLTDVSLADWKVYLRWQLISNASVLLTEELEQANFQFYSTTLRGTPSMRPRWKRIMSAIDGNIGEVLGQLYVAKAFPPQAKATALEMIENIRAALKERMAKMPWMEEKTRQQALKKVESFTPKIGYPDEWRDYSSLRFDRNDHFGNSCLVQQFDVRTNLDKIGKPVDKKEWALPPQTVNAYYNPLNNEIVFPAGILQPPFFDPNMDHAFNYGAIGVVIGHELMHGFDDSGSQFDADGNLKNWWTTDDRKRFEERADKLVAQFNNYKVLGDLPVNGQLTLGENIGDLGGVIISFEGLQKALKNHDKIDGLTPAQRFFLAYAQISRNNQRDESLRMMVNTNPHAPKKYRINGPLSNLEIFYKAFNCKSGDGMFREDKDRVKIW